MKYLILAIVSFCVFTQPLIAQLWIDKSFQYDSLLNQPYGKSIDFFGDEQELTMDIYLPTCGPNPSNSAKPLLIWIHGGAFLAGDKNDPSIQYLCKSYAKRGYVTASVNYRLGFVADDQPWGCTYPNYHCVFAADSTEWARAYYRAVQDCKGALRYLVNRHAEFAIDTQNIFIAGESAGAFLALGVGLLDTIIERPLETFAQPPAPSPSSNTFTCQYNQGKTFNGQEIARPDLGDISGSIEPTNIQYTIKGIGNMFGGMMGDLLKHQSLQRPKPAIYSFHQPCDMVVPIDSNFVYWGLSWCFTNGYNCYAITNNQMMLYGSRAFSGWNTAFQYGFEIHSEFTTTEFPFQYFFGQGSCLDQFSYPCHAYDNRNLREHNLALFFADKISSSFPCDSVSQNHYLQSFHPEAFHLFPNPATHFLEIAKAKTSSIILSKIDIYNTLGVLVESKMVNNFEDHFSLNIKGLPNGIYFIKLYSIDGYYHTYKIIKI